MTLPQIYEDAISCFCPRTAKMMKSSIFNYLTTGVIKISSRICTAPKAVLMLIIHDIHQNFNCSLTEGNCSLNEENCSLTEENCSLTEEEIKLYRDGKNTASLPPGLPIIGTSKGEKNTGSEKEKKEEKKSTTTTFHACARNFSESNERRKNFTFERK